jgi:hypothetical protein
VKIEHRRRLLAAHARLFVFLERNNYPVQEALLEELREVIAVLVEQDDPEAAGAALLYPPSPEK